MYKIVHLAAECFPIAKTGGLGDVVGALPKYLNKAGAKSCVIIPNYNQKWNKNNKATVVWNGNLKGEFHNITYSVNQYENVKLGFDFFLIDIPDLLFRENVYGYADDPLRFLFFQQAVLDWVTNWPEKPSVFHCHDHHTGLVPFMIKNCPIYHSIRNIKTVFTIHNGLYTGAFDWSLSKFFPEFSYQMMGFLDWDSAINPMAAGIKCCDHLTTVSEGYLDELKFQPNPLQTLYNQYWQKSKGIVNGIDSEVWDPQTDENLENTFKGNWTDFKLKNKKALCKSSGLDPEFPLVVFIGRLVNEKGGELLPPAIGKYLSMNNKINFFILGSGSNYIEEQLKNVTQVFNKNISTFIGYNESLAHQLYAAADFLIMPSIIEPCGLNQLYAMRYATVPMVRSVGGLKDTVVDFGDVGGYGIRFNNASVDDILLSLHRATELYKDKQMLEQVRKRLVGLNFSWDKVVKIYLEIYKN
jgi:starch synthase